MWFIPLVRRRPRAMHEGNKSHNHELKADKRLIFTLARIPQGMKKYTRKMPVLFMFLLFFNTPCWNWWDSQISRLFNHVSCISNKLFVLFVVNAWNRLAMLGDSESGLFITQSCFSGITSIELAKKTNFESLFAGADNEKAVYNFNLRTEDLLTDFFSDIEDSGRGIIFVTL